MMKKEEIHKNKIKIRSKIILIYAIAIAVACMTFYIVIPYLLNYSPDTINTEFDRQVSGGLYYYQQILLASILIVFVVSLILFIILRDVDNYPLYMKKTKENKEKIDSIKKNMFKFAKQITNNIYCFSFNSINCSIIFTNFISDNIRL